MEAAPEPAHMARSRRRSSCPAVWMDRQLTGRSAALRRHHAALPSEDTPRARCAAARSVIPHSPDAKVLTLDQGHVTICHNPSVHRTPCCPGVPPNGTRHQGVHGTVWCTEASSLSMCAPARAARVGAQPPAPTRSKSCPLPTGHKGGSTGHSGSTPRRAPTYVSRPRQRLEKTADKDFKSTKYFGIPLKRLAKLTRNKRI